MARIVSLCRCGVTGDALAVPGHEPESMPRRQREQPVGWLSGRKERVKSSFPSRSVRRDWPASSAAIRMPFGSRIRN